MPDSGAPVPERGRDCCGVSSIIWQTTADLLCSLQLLCATAWNAYILTAPPPLQTLKGLPIERKELAPLPREGEVEWADAVAATLASVPRDPELRKRAELCYGAWLGFMNGLKLLRWSKEQLVAEANLFARHIGLTEQPRLEKRTVGKMGLKGVPGLLFKSSGGG